MARISIPDLQAEFVNDPAGMGYTTAPVETDGYKTTKELLQLLGGRNVLDGSGNWVPKMVANSVSASQVPKPLDPSAILDVIPDSEYQAIPPESRASALAAIVGQDRAAITLLLKSFVKSAWITSTTANTLKTDWINATVTDPSHPTQIRDPLTPRVTVLWQGNTDAEQVDSALGRTS